MASVLVAFRSFLAEFLSFFLFFWTQFPCCILFIENTPRFRFLSPFVDPASGSSVGDEVGDVIWLDVDGMSKDLRSPLGSFSEFGLPC